LQKKAKKPENDHFAEQFFEVTIIGERMREIISFKSTPAPRFRYSPCVKTGPFYEFAGMIGLGADGKLAPDSLESETRQILRNMISAAKELDLSLHHLVAVNIYTTNFEQFPVINKVWEEFFTENVPPPARTSIGVSALPLNAMVEMSFRFYRD
jgi:2-iminobutanoate/2-iminopropanoate deaminase